MTPSVPTRRASDLDIELDGDAGELLQPVFGDHAGVEAGAAGDDGDARHVGEGKVHLRQRDLLLQRAEIGFRSEEHTSELQSLMRISYAVFCLKKNTQKHTQ